MDEESKVVRDRQDDNVLLDHLHCLHGYLTFFGHVILISFSVIPRHAF